jgi:hypothetical protein
MEVGSERLRLREASNQLTVARTEVHTFRDGPVDKVVRQGLEVTSGIEAFAARSFDELKFRQRGLAVSMVVILLVIVALVLKIRELEREPPREHET